MDDRPDDLISEVYTQLRRLAAHRMASEAPGHTLQPTALVHEVYLQLSKDRSMPMREGGRLFAAASQAMRRILVDHARNKKSLRRGGGEQRVPLDIEILGDPIDADQILDLDEALKDFTLLDPRAAQIVELRYFGGLTEDEVAAALEITARTVRRDWVSARLWLFKRIAEKEGGEHGE
ncbi:MAG: RNA polymerase sigma factor (TIGR02999 family) [Planctomycetota bacterium]|jgi:RNA polymerase sigma factor (TIGR02999 family)